jgi:hypothetical protein
MELLAGAIYPAFQAPAEDWGERVRNVLGALLDLIVELPDYACAALVESPGAGDKAYARYRAGINAIETMLDQGRSHAIYGFEPPPRVARAIVGGAEWLIRGEVIAGRTARIKALAPDFVYLALAPTLDQEEALRQAALAGGAGQASLANGEPA